MWVEARTICSMVQGPLESTTCRDVILPALRAAGWTEDQIVQQYPLQNRDSEHAMRQAKGRPRVADYVLEVDGVPVAVVEAKRGYRSAADGMGQAIDYAVRLDVPFAFASNGGDVLLHDRNAGTEARVASFPGPDEMWAAYAAGRGLGTRGEVASRVPYNRVLRSHGGREVKVPRYYQRAAVHRVIGAIDAGRTRVLLLMATGTGKTFTALQLVHKLREASRRLDEGRTYRVLYLADRDLLVSTPMADFVAAFGREPVARLSKHSTSQSRDLYFATYQGLDGESAELGEGETPPSVFESLPRDFFSLVVVDECHRGSASSGSRWRGILDHFDAAVQVGLTATPKRDTNVDTYEYFGDPVYEYSLAQGIEDGYLAPYRVRRVILDVDAFGWEAEPGRLDIDGREIPEGIYATPDFERRLSLPDRTAAMADHLVGLLREHPGDRAVAFCVSAQHAYEMKAALLAADPDKTRNDPEWAVRIVGTEPDRARFLQAFTDPETDSPQVATTARLLSTGVDIEDLRFVVLCRPVGSMVEFKQIVGRGTRLYPPKSKQYFEVVDYVGASAKFRDPEFDGPLPAPRTELVLDGETFVTDEGEDPLGPVEQVGFLRVEEPDPEFRREAGGDLRGDGDGAGEDAGPSAAPVRILTVEGEAVRLLGERLQLIDPGTGRLTTLEYRAFVRDRVRSLFPSADDLRVAWKQAEARRELAAELDRRGVDVDLLAEHVRLTDADAFDVLSAVAWDLEPQTRRERAERVRIAHGEEIERLGAVAREVIDVLLDRYAQEGIGEVTLAALQVRPLSERGTVVELAEAFGGGPSIRSWVDDLQQWLYEDDKAS